MINNQVNHAQRKIFPAFHKYFCLIALLLCVCTKIPDHCSNHNPYDPKTEFCFGDIPFKKCDGKAYNPSFYDCVIDENTGGDTLQEKCVKGKYIVSNEPCGDEDDSSKTVKFTVQFNTNGATPDTIITVIIDSGKTIGKNLPQKPVKTGFKFNGWADEDNTGYDSSSVITEDITLYAVWTENDPEITKYKVLFDINGESPLIIDSVTVDSGKTISKSDFPDEPERTGFMFDGWYDNNKLYDESTVITKNVTLKAKWIELRKITFDSRGGSLIEPQYAVQGEYIDMPNIPTKLAYVFDGWYIEPEYENEWHFEIHIVSSNMTLYAKWTQITITFNPYGGTCTAATATVSTTNSRLENLPVPARAPYTFGGWFTTPTDSTNKNVTTNTVFTKHTTLYARWTTTDNSHFNSDTAKVKYGFFTDMRDSVTYRTVKIGEQVWMAENLNYDRDSSWCYNGADSNCAKYGRLYTWTSAMDIGSKYLNNTWDGNDVNHQGTCPDGWHLPSDADWTALTNAIGSNVVTKLKSAMGWNTGSGYIAGTDNYGFSALPGGYRHSDGNIGNVGFYGNWWSATEYDASGTWNWGMSYGNSNVNWYNGYKGNAFSVRCLRD